MNELFEFEVFVALAVWASIYVQTLITRYLLFEDFVSEYPGSLLVSYAAL